MKTKASKKTSNIEKTVNDKEIKRVKQRRMVTVRADEEMEKDIITAKEKTGITLESQLIRAGLKKLIQD